MQAGGLIINCMGICTGYSITVCTSQITIFFFFQEMDSQFSFIISLLFFSVNTIASSSIENFIKLTIGVSKAAYLPLEGRRYLQNGQIMENPSTTQANIFSSYNPSQDKISCKVAGWTALSYKIRDTELILFTHSQQKLAVFGFRGTEPTNLYDWSQIFKMVLTPVRIASKVFKIHQGFNNRYLDIAPWFEKKFQEIPEDYTTLLTGHSLGAAMATVATAYVSGKLNKRPDAVITFGSPLVGDKDFQHYYNNVFGCGRTLRIAVKDDAITKAPSTLLGYTHVCSPLVLNSDASWLDMLKLIDNHDVYANYDLGLAKMYPNENMINLGCDRPI